MIDKWLKAMGWKIYRGRLDWGEILLDLAMVAVIVIGVITIVGVL